MNRVKVIRYLDILLVYVMDFFTEQNGSGGKRELRSCRVDQQAGKSWTGADAIDLGRLVFLQKIQFCSKALQLTV